MDTQEMDAPPALPARADTVRPEPRLRGKTAWAVGIAVALLVPVAVLSLGLASVVWVPLLFALGVAMCGVWAARRRRQRREGRSSGDIKDAASADRRWPSGDIDDIIDDRLPER